MSIRFSPLLVVALVAVVAGYVVTVRHLIVVTSADVSLFQAGRENQAAAAAQLREGFEARRLFRIDGPADWRRRIQHQNGASGAVVPAPAEPASPAPLPTNPRRRMRT